MNFNYASIALLVVLCWMSVGTLASSSNSTSDNSTTTAPASNMTTMASNMTTAAPASNMTTAASASNMTTAASASNMTTAASASSMTTAAPASNMTTAASASNMTTAASTSNMTTAVSASNTTATQASSTTVAPASNTTAAPASTTAAPNVTNITAVVLETNLTRTGCGSEKLCVSEPADCDPASGGCFFFSANQISGQNFGFELSGDTEGYVCLSLKPISGNEMAYVCAIDGNNVVFICATVNNNQLTPTTCPVGNIKGVVNGQRVQCTFDATVDNSTSARTTSTTFTTSIKTGAYNSANGELGPATTRLTSNNLNLANTNGAITLQQSISTALLIVLGVMSLTWL